MSWMTNPSRHRHQRPGNWKTLRANTLRRDRHQCQTAGPGCTRTATEVDHILNLAAGGTNHPDNLTSVCATCHRTKTNHEAAAGRRHAHQRAKHPHEDHPGLLPTPPTPTP